MEKKDCIFVAVILRGNLSRIINPAPGDGEGHNFRNIQSNRDYITKNLN